MGRLIVITGGPCGGKSTIVESLRSRLARAGKRVLVIPEAARLAISILGHARSARAKRALQGLIVRLQLTMEDGALAAAAPAGIVLADRGILDSEAYLGPGPWQTLRRHLGWRERDLLERYTAVLHLTSCAVDKAHCYRQDAQRRESLALARRIDAAIWRAWRNHPLHFQIDNSAPTLEGKTQEVFETVRNLRATARP